LFRANIKIFAELLTDYELFFFFRGRISTMILQIAVYIPQFWAKSAVCIPQFLVKSAVCIQQFC
jgi:hypothetical protein